MNSISSKYENLLQIIARTGGAVTAFSGGVDSTLLLHAARQILGERAVAVTISTPYVPRWELKEACRFTEEAGIRHEIVEIPFPEELRFNPPEHCYTCKKILFNRLLQAAQDNGFSRVLDGTNMDDLDDYRPGIRALRELNILSPFVEAGLTKQEIRELSRQLSLPTWKKPSFACLLSRMPVNTEVTDSALRQVEEAERYLMSLGFHAVRVRHHGEVARIEIPRERIPEFIKVAEQHDIDSQIKNTGYRHVALDLGGYSMGSLNRSSLQE